MNERWAMLSVAVVIAFGSCGRSETEAAPEVAAAPSTARETTEPVVPAPPAERNATPTDDPPTTIAGRLDAERRSRTGVKPEAEDALAAFSSAGLEVKDVRQGVARTSKARYCVFGTSPGGHRVMVCEFLDAAEAERGATFMASQLVDPRRRVEARGRLALTVFSTGQTPEADRERARYFEIFAALPDAPR